jgi:antitoxin component of MazEF toxin-antitoxin module
MNKSRKQVLIRRVVRMPHSIALVIPKFWCDLHSIEPRDTLEIEVQLNRLVISIPDRKEELK